MRIKNYDRKVNEYLQKKAEEEGSTPEVVKKFRTKTRSKQKYLRKYKRPIEVKR